MSRTVLGFALPLQIVDSLAGQQESIAVGRPLGGVIFRRQVEGTAEVSQASALANCPAACSPARRR
jgi:hypothetical protein